MGKSVEDPRRNIVSMRLTDDELEDIDLDAKVNGLKRSDVLRNRTVRPSCARCANCGDERMVG